MKEGTTSTGFAYKLEDERIDDYELFEQICALDEGNNSVLPRVARLMLGDEQLQALKDHVKAQTGRVSTSGMMAEIKDIMLGAAKN